jgi:hypothetical protein
VGLDDLPIAPPCPAVRLDMERRRPERFVIDHVRVERADIKESGDIGRHGTKRVAKSRSNRSEARMRLSTGSTARQGQGMGRSLATTRRAMAAANPDVRAGATTVPAVMPSRQYLRVQAAPRVLRNGRFAPKHEVAALQPAAREQEPRGRQPIERTGMARWQGRHDQLMYCRRATHDQEQQGSSGRPATLMRRVTSTPP